MSIRKPPEDYRKNVCFRVDYEEHESLRAAAYASRLSIPLFCMRASLEKAAELTSLEKSSKPKGKK